jgi:Flp pilus assembly protein TadB
MDSALLLAGAAAGAAVALLYAYFYGHATLRQRIISSRISQGAGDLGLSHQSSILRQRRSSLPLVGRLPLSVEATERMTGELMRAGWTLKVHEYLGLRLVCAAAGTVIGLVVMKRGEIKPDIIEWLLVFVIAFSGWLLPRFALSYARQKRRQRIEDQLPDALMSIAKSLRSGSGILQALTPTWS